MHACRQERLKLSAAAIDLPPLLVWGELLEQRVRQRVRANVDQLALGEGAKFLRVHPAMTVRIGAWDTDLRRQLIQGAGDDGDRQWPEPPIERQMGSLRAFDDRMSTHRGRPPISSST